MPPLTRGHLRRGENGQKLAKDHPAGITSNVVAGRALFKASCFLRAVNTTAPVSRHSPDRCIYRDDAINSATCRVEQFGALKRESSRIKCTKHPLIRRIDQLFVFKYDRLHQRTQVITHQNLSKALVLHAKLWIECNTFVFQHQIRTEK
jgi:hypothetical protein